MHTISDCDASIYGQVISYYMDRCLPLVLTVTDCSSWSVGSRDVIYSLVALEVFCFSKEDWGLGPYLFSASGGIFQGHLLVWFSYEPFISFFIFITQFPKDCRDLWYPLLDVFIMGRHDYISCHWFLVVQILKKHGFHILVEDGVMASS